MGMTALMTTLIVVTSVGIARAEEHVDADGCIVETQVTEQPKPKCDPDRVLVFYDRSGSMWGRGPDGNYLYKSAGTIIETIAKEYPRADIQVVPFPALEANPKKQACGIGERISAATFFVTPSLRKPRPESNDSTPIAQTIRSIAKEVRDGTLPPPDEVLLITDGEDRPCRNLNVQPLPITDWSELLEEQFPSAGTHSIYLPHREETSKTKKARALEQKVATLLADLSKELAAKATCRLPTESVEEAKPLPKVTRREPKDPFADVVAVGDEDEWRCSGVLVDDGRGRSGIRVALTAKHCLPATRIGFGGADWQSFQQVKLERTVEAPDVDVVALVLRKPISRPTHFRRRATDSSTPGGRVRVVGFGADDSRGRSGAGDLHIVDLPANGWGCSTSNARTIGCVPDHELVLRGSGGTDSCKGDSGGPAFERVGCRLRLIGITSRAVASARRVCGDGGIYTRVDRLDGWLEEIFRNLE
jgi:hypothetical protein